MLLAYGQHVDPYSVKKLIEVAYLKYCFNPDRWSDKRSSIICSVMMMMMMAVSVYVLFIPCGSFLMIKVGIAFNVSGLPLIHNRT